MATKSITKSIHIKSVSSCKKLVAALERSKVSPKKATIIRNVEELKGDKIRALWSEDE